MHAVLAAVPATASNNDVFRYKRRVQRTSSVAEDAHFHSAIGRHTVYQVALYRHVGAAGDAETVGPIAGNRSVVHNPGILHLGIGAAGSRVGISRQAVVAGASDETVRRSEADSQFRLIRRVAIVEIDPVRPTVGYAAVLDRPGSAAHPLGVAMLHPDSVHQPIAAGRSDPGRLTHLTSVSGI